MTLERSSLTTQSLLKEAEALLKRAVTLKEPESNPRLHMLYAFIVAVRTYSNSLNEHSGLRGLGLEEACTLAQTVIANPPKSDRDVHIENYRLIGNSIKLTLGQ